MKAILYDIKVCDGVLGYAHGSYQLVHEIYVPELELYFNDKGYVFKDEDRNRHENAEPHTTTTIEINDKFALGLNDYFNAAKTKDDVIKAIFRPYVILPCPECGNIGRLDHEHVKGYKVCDDCFNDQFVFMYNGKRRWIDYTEDGPFGGKAGLVKLYHKNKERRNQGKKIYLPRNRGLRRTVTCSKCGKVVHAPKNVHNFVTCSMCEPEK